MKIDITLLEKILKAWFDDGRYIVGNQDAYGDTRYIGLHAGRCSEVVMNAKQEDCLTFYQIDRGQSYLNAFHSDDFDPTGKDHAKNMELIGMKDNGNNFSFDPVRNYSECHTTVIMIK